MNKLVILGGDMRKDNKKVLLLSALFMCVTSTFAATPVDLSHQPSSFLKTFSSSSTTVKNVENTPQTSLKQMSSDTDFNHTQHIRVQQTYSGYSVWGADAIVHIPQGNNKKSLTSALTAPSAATTMDGTVYQDLNKDLANTPASVFTAENADKALQQAIRLYAQKHSLIARTISNKKTTLMVYVDDNNKAHWALLISFYIPSTTDKPAKPTYIVDATNYTVYRSWDDIKTLDNIQAGGFGGNALTGKIAYDGQGEYPLLDMQRDAATQTCFLQNARVTILDVQNNDNVIQFKCDSVDGAHNVYWDADLDAANGAFSPANDALYVGKKVAELYENWYHIPALMKGNDPMLLKMRVHDRSENGIENAYWDDENEQMTFGDGENTFYPLVSLGIAAHEISHGFTHQHADLVYEGQSGGLNESFSDMAAAAAEYLTTNNNTWKIGSEVMKQSGAALRYMDNPSQDCDGRNPGDFCSISNAKQFTNELDVHFSSGVFNKIFYEMSTAPNWTTQKAFDVMVDANRYYWTSTASFKSAACGVIKAAKSLNYDLGAVTAAMKKAEIDVSRC